MKPPPLSALPLPRWVAAPAALFAGNRVFALLAGIVVLIGVCGWQADRARVGKPENTGGTRYDAAIRRAAGRHMPEGWDWRILKAMIRQESNFRRDASSRTGARGLAQVMPGAAKDVRVPFDELHDPRRNINTGTRYLRLLWDRWSELPDRAPRWERSRFAVASYNAGYTTVRRATKAAGCPVMPRWDAVRDHVPEETRVHIDKVFDTYYPVYRRRHPGGGSGVADVFRRKPFSFTARIRARR